MGNIAEIKRRIEGLKMTLGGLRERVVGLIRSAGPGLKEQLKKEGTRLGIGSGLSFLGLMVLAVAAVYLVAGLILALDLALKRLWLSALIVAGALSLLGVLVAGLGAVVSRRSARRMQDLAEGAGRETAAVRELAEEVRGELKGLQELARSEAEVCRRQAQQIIESVRRLAPAIVALIVLLALWRRRRRRKKRKRSAEAPVLIREVIREE